MKAPGGIKIVTKNRKAFHDYHLEDRFEAGIVLVGSEVKSLRDGRANLSDAYALIKEGELFLVGAHIAPYQPAGQMQHEPKRTRKLLMHRRELDKLAWKLREKGLTIVPTMLYFKGGRAKAEVALARGKRQYDKRAAIKKRESDREVSRAMRRKHR